MNAACTAIISGRVQLVMFRDFVQRTARSLGIVGEVRNMPDNTVHVHAEGERERLDQLIAHLTRGPLLAKVDQVAVQWVEPSNQFDGFSIRY